MSKVGIAIMLHGSFSMNSRAACRGRAFVTELSMKASNFNMPWVVSKGIVTGS